MSQTLLQPLRFDDRAAFRAWAAQQPRGRWERENGVVVAMAPERITHTRIKYNIWLALRTALRESGLPCEALGDGVTVEIDDETDYEPDAVVICGERVDGSGTAITNPVIVVEVLSPSTGSRDSVEKLDGYFRLPSVQHYLLVASNAVRVTHHRRWTEDRLLTSSCRDGTLDLDPPGFQVAIGEFYRDTGLPSAT